MADKQPRPRWQRWVVAAAVVALAAAAAVQVVDRAFFGPPNLEVGKVPSNYEMDVAKPNDKVDLGKVGMARLGGTVDPKVKRVVVSQQGAAAEALIDRTVDPAVWWLPVAAPEAGTFTFHIVAEGADGKIAESDVPLTFKWPKPTDEVVTPEAVVLGKKGGPKLSKWDEKANTAVVTDVPLGVIRQKVFLVSGSIEKIAPTGLMRRVVSYVRKGDTVTAVTEPARFDELIFQAKLEDPKTPIGGRLSASGRAADCPESFGKKPEFERPEMDWCLGVGKGLPGGGVDHWKGADIKEQLGNAAGDVGDDIVVTIPKLPFSFAYGLSGKVAVGLDMDIDFHVKYFFLVKPEIRRFAVGTELSIVVAASMSVKASADTKSESDLLKAFDPGAWQRLVDSKKIDAKSKSKNFEWNGPTLAFSIGPVPVTLTPYVSAVAGIDASVSATLKLGAASGFKLAAGWVYGHGGYADSDGGLGSKVGVAYSGSATAYIESDIGIRLWDALSTSFFVKPSIEGTAVVESGSVKGPGLRFDAKAGVEAGLSLGVQVPLLDLQLLDLDVSLINVELARLALQWYPLNPDPAGRDQESTAPSTVDSVKGDAADGLSVLLLMDTSGSMDDPDASGTVKRIDGAKTAIRNFMSSVSKDAKVGLRTYPAPGEDCGVGVRRIPVSKVDPAEVTSIVDQLTPSGGTPTHLALEAAVGDLGSAGYRTIVLVSDGETNCGGEGGAACDVARQIEESGIEMTVNTVGFQISGAGEEELRCIAQATSGTYASVDNSDALVEELERLTKPVVTVSIDAPTDVQLDENGRSGGIEVTATINNAGTRPAEGVSVTLAADGEPKPDVADAGKLLGRIEGGERRTATWTISPSSATSTYGISLKAVAQSGDLPPQTATHNISMIGSGDAKTMDLGPVLTGVKRIAILGDSYSSGEGSGTYQRDRNAPDSCHRSNLTYGRLSEGEIFRSRTVLACSGATSPFVAGTASTKNAGQVNQATQLSELVGSSSVDAVLMTIGGNDVSFRQIITACLTAQKCGPAAKVCVTTLLSSEQCTDGRSAEEAFSEGLRGLQDSVVAALESVHARLNSPKARGSRHKMAPIIVLAYPKLFPDAASRQTGCTWGVQANEIRYVNRVVERLNDAINHHVEVAQGMGVPVYFARSSERAFTENGASIRGEANASTGHTLCDPNPFAVGPKAITDLAKLGNQVFHPNADGYVAMTQALIADAKDFRPLPRIKVPPVDPAPSDPSMPPPKTLYAGMTVEPGDTASIPVKGASPGTGAIGAVASQIAVAGQAVVGENGKANLIIRIPEWLEDGNHEVIVRYMDKDGGFVEATAPIKVDRPIDPQLWWWLVAAAALLVAAVAAWWLRRRWRGGRRDAGPGHAAGSDLYDPAVL